MSQSPKPCSMSHNVGPKARCDVPRASPEACEPRRNSGSGRYGIIARSPEFSVEKFVRAGKDVEES